MYKTFLELLREFQTGTKSQKEVVFRVGELLSTRPDLVLEFNKCYVSYERTDSQITISASETTPLLDQNLRDVESHQTKSKKTFYWGIAVVFAVAITIAYFFNPIADFFENLKSK